MNSNKLPGDYIAGFVDGEGCFVLTYRRDVRHDRKNSPEYFYWRTEFAILLKSDDKNILEKIKNTLRCGWISINKNNGARYTVSDINDLYYKIIPFFDKYKLRAKKRHDYKLWKEAVEIFKNNQLKIGKGVSQKMWDEKDMNRLKEIHNEMMEYKGGTHRHKWLS